MVVLSALFVGGLAVLCMFYVVDGNSWALYPANSHIYNNGNIVQAGTITDRNGVVLAQTKQGISNNP